MEQAQAFELLHKLEAEIASVDATLAEMKAGFEGAEIHDDNARASINLAELDVYAEVVNLQTDLQAKWLHWRLERLQKALVKFYGGR